MKCSNCGSEIGEEDKFCTKCGQAITSQNSTPGVPKNNKKNNIGLVIGVVILAVIALIAVVTVLDTKENESEGNGQEPIINENTNDEKSGEVETPTTVEFNGYTFAVPSNVTALLVMTNYLYMDLEANGLALLWHKQVVIIL